MLGKDNYQGEIKAFVEDAGFRDEHEFYMLSLITMGYQIRYYKSMNESRPLPILPATANGRDNLLEYNEINFTNGVFENDYVKLFKSVAHGECWSNKVYLLGFEEKDYDQFGQALVGFYSCFDDFRQLSALGGESRIAYRYSGLDFMTKEEREELVRNREYFYRGKTLAKALESVGWDKGRLKDLLDGEEMLELYTRLLGDGKSAKEEADFVKKLEDDRMKLFDLFNVAIVLKDALDKNGALPVTYIPIIYDEINDALEEGTDDPSLLMDPQVCMDQRWRRFLTRFSDISGVDELQAYRGRKIGDRLQVSADNKGSTALDNTEKVLSNTGQVTKSSKATKLSADDLLS